MTAGLVATLWSFLAWRLAVRLLRLRWGKKSFAVRSIPVARSRTNTPLQALVLLNDIQFVEAARELAERVLESQPDDQARITAAFLALASREPDSRELEVLVKLLADERGYYGESPDEAQGLLGLGDAQEGQSAPHAQWAAMTVVCQAILNLDSTIWSR